MTQVAKFLSKLRIDNDQRLGEMAVLFCIVYELCHWFEDFKYGILVSQSITHSETRRLMAHIIELYTMVSTCHVFPCDALPGMKRNGRIGFQEAGSLTASGLHTENSLTGGETM